MTVLLMLGGLLSLLVPPVGAGPAAVAAIAALAGPALAAPQVAVTVEPGRHRTVIGGRFTVRSRLANSGPAATGPLLVHLDVASLGEAVDVDPEDWSVRRTVGVGPLRPGGSTTVSWELQAVNAGTFAVYVVVLDGGGTAAPGMAAGPPLQVEVGGGRTLKARGALPVVLGMPVLLGTLAVNARRRTRREA